MTLAAVAPIPLGGGAAQAKSFSVLHSFTGTPDGGRPVAAVIEVGGTLYGTTLEGGANNYGSVFTITPAGAEAVLYSFQGGADGEGPEANLLNVGGVFYGTTAGGGNGGCGTVFKITAAGVEAVLYAFGAAQNDGCGPVGGLINVNGTLYGTTYGGASSGRGTVFKVTRSGKETVLHSFGANGDGSYPEAGLMNVGGTLYGTTLEGGVDDLGTVFTISRAGKEAVLYAFQYGSDTNGPMAPLLDVGGTLYGTATGGGGTSCDQQKYSCGAVFTITPKGREAVLYSFQGKPDGMLPEAGLINVDGNLYGTTAWEGDGKNCAGHGCGTVFKLTPAGAETVVHSFTNGQGIYPSCSLLKLGHRLYGTTPEFGGSGDGSVFRVNDH